MFTTRLLHVPRALEPTISRVYATTTPQKRSYASSQGYGDSGSDSQIDNPTKAGIRNRIDTEHPGPEPVDEGKGTGSGGFAETGRPQGEQSGGENGVGKSGTGGDGKPQPKITSQAQPAETGNEEVDRHNKEAAARFDRNAANGGDEKVPKGFWSGKFGFLGWFQRLGLATD